MLLYRQLYFYKERHLTNYIKERCPIIASCAYLDALHIFLTIRLKVMKNSLLDPTLVFS